MAGISIKEIKTSDTVSDWVEKVNKNFDQLMLAGGGPPGPTGPKGNQGVPGPDGRRGSLWTAGPTSSIPQPFDGDKWLMPNGDVYTYQNGSFVQTGVNIRGPKGATGPKPPQLFQSYIGREVGASWLPDVGNKGQTGVTTHPDFFALNAQESGSTKGPDSFILGPVRDFESMGQVRPYDNLPRLVLMQTNHENGLMISRGGTASMSGSNQPASNLRFDHASRFYVDSGWNLFIQTGYSSGGSLKKDINITSTGRTLMRTPNTLAAVGASGYSGRGNDILFSAPGNVGIDYEFPSNKLSLNGQLSVGTNEDLNSGVSASFTQNVGIGVTGPNPKLAVNGDVSVGYNAQDSGSGDLLVKNRVGIGTTQPDWALEVQGQATVRERVLIGNGLIGNDGELIVAPKEGSGATAFATLQGEDLVKVEAEGRGEDKNPDFLIRGATSGVDTNNQEYRFKTTVSGGKGLKYTKLVNTGGGGIQQQDVYIDGGDLILKGGDEPQGGGSKGNVDVIGHDLNITLDHNLKSKFQTGVLEGNYDSGFAVKIFNQTDLNNSDNLNENPRGLEVGEDFSGTDGIQVPDESAYIFRVNTPQGADNNGFNDVPRNFAINNQGRMIFSPNAVGFGVDNKRRLLFWQQGEVTINGNPSGLPGEVLASSKRSTDLNYNNSSREIKKDIKVLGKTLDLLNQISLYSYKDIEEEDRGKFYGPIVEELEEILPDAVNYLDDGPAYHIPTFMSAIMKGIQELTERVERLESGG